MIGKKGVGETMSEEIRFSLSSEEDVYDFLSKLSYIYEGKEKDVEMFSIYCEFADLIEIIPSNEYIKLYHDMQVGKIKSNKDGTIIEQCSQLLKVSTEEFKSLLHANVLGVKNARYEKWLDYINSRYKNVLFSKKLGSESKQASILHSEIKPPALQKRLEKTLLTDKQQEQKERDLSDLVEYADRLEEEINKMNRAGASGSQESKKLAGIRIQVLKDINIIRKSYGEVLGSQNSHGRRSFISYEGDSNFCEEIIDCHEKQKNYGQQDQINEIDKEEKLNSIKNIAKNILTNRQYLIFEFYYFGNLTQQEIADMMGFSQQMVNKDLKNIVKKIKEKI